MKKIKNNKGITGIDITTSIVILIIAIGIIMSMYSKYIDNSKIVKRNTEANNLAMNFVEYIEKTDYDSIDILFDTDGNGVDNVKKITAGPEDDIIGAFGIGIKNVIDQIPKQYTITFYKQDEIDSIALKLKVEVSYYIKDKNYIVSLSKVKTKIINQVNFPDIDVDEVKKVTKGENNRYFLKYSNLKNGYVQTSISDNEWYSISGKRCPIAVYANPNDFDLNGVINLSDCNQIYVWVPRFGKISGELYGFGYDTTDYIITYGDTLNKITEGGTKYSIIGYVDNKSKLIKDVSKDFDGVSGKWVEVNSNLCPIDDSGNEITDENNILNMLKTKQFTWDKNKM